MVSGILAPARDRLVRALIRARARCMDRCERHQRRPRPKDPPGLCDQPPRHQRVSDQRRRLQWFGPQRLRPDPAEDAVGKYPAAIAVDTALGTAYVSNLNTVSVIPLRH
jgi:hypothetical protein